MQWQRHRSWWHSSWGAAQCGGSNKIGEREGGWGEAVTHKERRKGLQSRFVCTHKKFSLHLPHVIGGFLLTGGGCTSLVVFWFSQITLVYTCPCKISCVCMCRSAGMCVRGHGDKMYFLMNKLHVGKKYLVEKIIPQKRAYVASVSMMDVHVLMFNERVLTSVDCNP